MVVDLEDLLGVAGFELRCFPCGGEEDAVVVDQADRC